MLTNLVDIIWLADEISYNAHYMDITSELQVHLGLQNIEQHIHKYDDVRRYIHRFRSSTDRSIILFICRNEPLNTRDLLVMCDLTQVEDIYELVFHPNIDTTPI